MKKLFLVSVGVSLLFLIGCTTTRTVYDQQAVYENQTTEYEVEVEKEVEVEIPPIVTGNLVVAFTRFAGADDAVLDRVAESIRLGFIDQSQRQSGSRIRYVSRAELLRRLSQSQLRDLGPEVEKTLREEYDVNIICTGTVLSDSSPIRLAIEVLDYRTDRVYSEEFIANDWSEIGKEVAAAFFGTRTNTEIVTEVETRTKTERVMVRPATGRRQVTEVDWGSTFLLFITVGATLWLLSAM